MDSTKRRKWEKMANEKACAGTAGKIRQIVRHLHHKLVKFLFTNFLLAILLPSILVRLSRALEKRESRKEKNQL